MKKKIIFVGSLVMQLFLFSQNSSHDTIDNPYWQQMMLDRNINFYSTKHAFDLYFSNKPKIKGSGFKQFERWAENAIQDIDEEGNFKPSDYIENEVKNFKRTQLSPRGGQGSWQNLGPYNNPAPASMQRGVGRINEIAYHPTDPNIIYAGSPAGGFWKSIDKGTSWTSNTDLMPSLGISAIVAIPNGVGEEPTILIGTGDRDANETAGNGIFVSEDGGLSFIKSSTGMNASSIVSEMLVNPMNSENIIAATSTGIYKSYNRGKTWALVASSGNYTDIKYAPNDTMTLYATAGGSFYRSGDGGKNWTRIGSGFSSNNRNRLAIATTEANPNIVYIIASAGSGTNTNGMEGFYKSSDKGLNFKLTMSGTTYNPLGNSSNGRSQGGQGWYDIAIVCSPTDSNYVLVGGVNIFKTSNGGTSFTCAAFWSYHPTIPWVHADIHYLGINPVSKDLFVGSDGGVDISTDLGKTYSSINNGLSVSMFYNLGVSQKSMTKFITGSQDNGTSGGESSNSWTAMLAGDGMHCDISNFDEQVMFGSLYYGDIYRSSNGGSSWNNINGDITETGPWVTPYHLHPRVDNFLASVYQNVWVSKDAITSSFPNFTKSTVGVSSNGSAMRFSNVDDNFLIVGWEDGSIRYSSNILSNTPTFTAIANNGFSSGRVNDIETSFKDPNIFYVAKGTKIYKTRDKGVTWTNISSNLPNITIHCIVLDKNSPEGIYVGTQSGVYYKDSTMTNWIEFSNGLSLNPSIRDIEIVYDADCSENSKLFAASYGRGLWISNLYKDTTKTKFLTVSTDKGNSEICRGEKLLVTLDGGVNYSISPTVSTTKKADNTFELYPTENSVYTIIAKDANGTCETKNLNIVVNESPKIMVTPTNKTISNGQTVTITASGGDEYSWTPTTGLIGSNTAAQITVKPATSTIYTVKGTKNGCSSTAKSSINLSGASAILDSEMSLSIFPNPISNSLHIKGAHMRHLSILNLEGRLLIEKSIEGTEHLVDVSHLRTGIYMLLVKNELGDTLEYKIKIER